MQLSMRWDFWPEHNIRSHSQIDSIALDTCDREEQINSRYFGPRRCFATEFRLPTLAHHILEFIKILFPRALTFLLPPLSSSSLFLLAVSLHHLLDSGLAFDCQIGWLTLIASSNSLSLLTLNSLTH